MALSSRTLGAATAGATASSTPQRLLLLRKYDGQFVQGEQAPSGRAIANGTSYQLSDENF